MTQCEGEVMNLVVVLVLVALALIVDHCIIHWGALR